MTNEMYNLARMTNDPAKFRHYIPEHGGKIISEFAQTFRDGCTEAQFYVEDDAGKKWHLAPFACRHSQSEAGQYSWVKA